jgi:hypothetical protein
VEVQGIKFLSHLLTVLVGWRAKALTDNVLLSAGVLDAL